MPETELSNAPVGGIDNGRWLVDGRLLDVPARASQAAYPEQLLENAADALEEILSARVEIHWANTNLQPPEPRAPGRRRLRVTQQEAPYAILDVVREEPFDPPLSRALDHLATDLTLAVDAMTMSLLRRAVRDLRTAMFSGTDLDQVTEGAVSTVVRHLGAEAGMLILRRTDEPRMLASKGAWGQDDASVRRRAEIALRGLEAYGPLAHGDGYVTVPVASSRPARIVLLLRFAPHNEPHSLTYPALTEMASVAAPYIDTWWRDRVLIELLELNRASEDTSTSEIYGRVLQAALALVPGADSGTLLTRTSESEPFRYQAAEGFDLGVLRGQTVPEASARAWYGEDDEGWHQGRPRVLSSKEVDIPRLGAASDMGAGPKVLAYDRIQSTLCLPVHRDGVVMAILNLDNLQEADGLGRDSAQLAALFGAPLASLLHRQKTRDLLHAAALTDDLTGLDNRRYFEAALSTELSRAARGGTGPSLMLLDLRGFKQINDAFGHDRGDWVLKRVAATLRSNLREIDVAARLGGDEFVVLLMDTPPGEADAVAARIGAAIGKLDGGLGPLTIDIGVASYAADGGDGARLLRLADERMYEAKRAGAARKSATS